MLCLEFFIATSSVVFHENILFRLGINTGPLRLLGLDITTAFNDIIFNITAETSWEFFLFFVLLFLAFI